MELSAGVTDVCLSEGSIGTVSGGHVSKDVAVLFCTFFKVRNSFLTRFQSIFDGDLYFSGRFPSSSFLCVCDVVISCLVVIIQSSLPSFYNSTVCLPPMCFTCRLVAVVESHVRALCCKYRYFIDTWVDGPNLTSLLSVSQFV